jgi:hypothetical protein
MLLSRRRLRRVVTEAQEPARRVSLTLALMPPAGPRPMRCGRALAGPQTGLVVTGLVVTGLVVTGRMLTRLVSGRWVTRRLMLAPLVLARLAGPPMTARLTSAGRLVGLLMAVG